MDWSWTAIVELYMEHSGLILIDEFGNGVSVDVQRRVLYDEFGNEVIADSLRRVVYGTFRTDSSRWIPLWNHFHQLIFAVWFWTVSLSNQVIFFQQASIKACLPYLFLSQLLLESNKRRNHPATSEQYQPPSSRISRTKHPHTTFSSSINSNYVYIPSTFRASKTTYAILRYAPATTGYQFCASISEDPEITLKYIRGRGQAQGEICLRTLPR